MSAFVVEDKTINRIFGWLNNHDNQHTLHCVLRAADICVQDNASLPWPQDWHERLGVSMFTLNCDAVDSRYGSNQAQEFRPLNYSFTYEQASEIQVLKSLQCWLYQCS